MAEIISSLNYFPEEIINLIFDNLDLINLLVLSSTNIWLMNHIRSTKWNNIYVRIKNINDINYVMNTFKFINYDFSYSQITDSNVKLFAEKQVRKLNLSGCAAITDSSVKLLGKCHTVFLYDCIRITDSSVKYLGNCHTLNLYSTKITDESVKYLNAVQNLIR